MAANYWLKLWTEALDDRKVASLPDSSYRRWIECLMLAKEYDRDGLLPSIEDMAWRLRLTVDSLQSDMSRLAANGLVELVATDDGERWFITQFANRQRASTPAERKAQQRARDNAGRYSHDDVTFRDDPVTQSRVEQSRAEQSKSRAEAEAEETGACAVAAAAYLKQFGIAYNAKTAPIADMPEDYIRGHIEHMRKNGDKPGLAITRMLDGDPVPGSRPVDLTRQIPADLADIIQR
jgi:hypothetical protein